MKRLVALLVGMLISDAAVAADKVTKEKITLGGVERVYYLAMPSELKPGETLPLLLAFHGSGRDGDSVVEKWARIARKERLVVVGLDALDHEQWQIPQDGPGPVYELVEALRQRLPIDPSRMYLFGHSAGAVFALRLVLLESEYFAAAAVHAGSFRTDGDYATIQLAKRKPPVMVISGDRDQFFPVGSVHATIQALKDAGIPAQVEIMKGHDHWYYTLATSINAGAWEFLKGQKLPSEPRYEAYIFR